MTRAGAVRHPPARRPSGGTLAMPDRGEAGVTMTYDKAVYALRKIQKKDHPWGAVKTDEIDSLIGQGAVAELSASSPSRRGLLPIAGNFFAVFTVGGEVVREIGITKGTKHEGALRQWVLAFNAASKPNQPAEVAPATDALTQLASLHDAGLLTDEEFAAKRAEVIGRI
jgi:hypothetical protein